MKVEFARYRKILEEKLGEKFEHASDIVDEVIDTFRNNLHCSACDEIKPKKHFYPNKQYKARGGYSTICCKCGPKYQKLKRQERKPLETEDGK